MAILSLRLAASAGFAAPPYPRNRSGGFAFSSSSCRAVAAAAGPGLPITVAGDPPTVVSAPGRRIVAIGDVHGDLYQTRAALKMAGVLSVESDGHVWTGGRTVLVQVGDILDRGEDEIAILSLLSSLNVQAKSHGGAVFQVNGNHETMNVEGDFRYVDPGGFDECIRFLEYLDECDGNWDDAFLNWVNVAERRKKEYGASPNGDWRPWNFVKKQKGIAARTSLFKRGGLLACELARHPVVLKINDWIFCHGGLLPHHAEYGIERMNKEVSMWMKCSGEDSDDETDIPFIATRGYDSVVWSRLYSQDPAERTRRSLMLSSVVAEQTLKTVGAKGMVVGHTPQTHGVNCKCDGKVWCVDVGMSYGVLYSRPEVLEIVNDRPRVLKKQRDSYDEMEVLDYL
ncbi:shewanella-like protein phosphatase 1 [Phragmites australis]|uniref:shewanella-like protein phosphatase 1 n=1 Tax=Phragmites australis TaxID=29695 RepID=UPI002D79E7E9|nr:shewanella-like protein phosphatase 1 [Phragmites australis]